MSAATTPGPCAALLLDSGGVLLQMSGNVLRAAAVLHGVQLSEADAQRGVHAADACVLDDPALATAPFAVRWGRAVGCSDDEAIVIWEQLAARVTTTLQWSCVNVEAAALLAALPRDLPKVVVSNSDGGAASELEAVGLRHYFTAVVDSGQLGVTKPDRRIFEIAAGLAGADLGLGSCVYVSDRLDGPVGGGLSQILYDPYDVYPAHVVPPDVRVVRDLREVARMLARPV